MGGMRENARDQNEEYIVATKESDYGNYRVYFRNPTYECSCRDVRKA